jgi:putative GTP pyrophosphokinase
MLQHAWAEVEHDLGYKTAFAVPDVIRRRFARVAGLLELADHEFAEIRGSASRYRSSLPQRIDRAPDTVTIDRTSIEVFVLKDPLVEAVDAQIAQARSVSLHQYAKEAAYFSADRLQLAGLETIADVASALRANRDHVIRLATKWLDRSGSSSALSRGISLFYLAYVVVLRSGDEDRVRSFMASARLQDAADALLETWRELDA